MQSNTAKKKTELSLLDKVRNATHDNKDGYLITIRFLDKVLGTQPRSEEIMRNWLESKLAKESIKAAKTGAVIPTEAQRKEITEIQVANMAPKSADEVLDEGEDKAWTGFFTDDDGIWMGTYQVKACLRDCLTSLGITVAKRGSKQTMQHLMDIWACDAGGNILPNEKGQRLRFHRNGKYVKAADDHVEMTAHVMTAQGPRSVIKRHDYVQQAELTFLLTTVRKDLLSKRETAHLGEKEIVKVLSFMQGNALGCSRSQGFGKFEVVGLAKLEG